MQNIETQVRAYWQKMAAEHAQRADYWRIPWTRGGAYEWQPNARVEAFIAKVAPPIVVKDDLKAPQFLYGKEQERFHNEIEMLPRAWFAHSVDYYAGLLHETVHSTSAPDKRPRIYTEPFYDMIDSSARPIEEAGAEIGAHALLHHFRLATKETDRNQAAYIAGWLERYQDALPQAQQLADDAVSYLLEKAGEK